MSKAAIAALLLIAGAQMPSASAVAVARPSTDPHNKFAPYLRAAKRLGQEMHQQAQSYERQKQAERAADVEAKLAKIAATANAPHGNQPCQCETSNGNWVQATRTDPECVFIDLGAADGNTFKEFLKDKYGSVAGCPNGKYKAVLVEANPRFNSELTSLAAQHQGSVEVHGQTAAYMCEGTTSFYLDTVNGGSNYCGSSMSNNHPDVKKSGLQEVTVSTLNLNRYLYENTIPGDWVIIKMDIEGAEWEVIPCLSDSPSASLVDRLFVEEHYQGWSYGVTTQEEMDAAKTKLQSLGVDMPKYSSLTLLSQNTSCGPL
eukprot:CAMPEP_0178415290 /NCGR_PEP_ID=MMETSP0689_2-20121128/23476_1 /TAXON_ID=160604 /ORGANISM="Amphidinium massartii, Strain CS-259" /LENGTH=315 /DNA_ID=CAMNT_0020036607 /DNA_START=103 /DNA_END=1047 /DNA_ORIENTATION=-